MRKIFTLLSILSVFITACGSNGNYSSEIQEEESPEVAVVISQTEAEKTFELGIKTIGCRMAANSLSIFRDFVISPNNEKQERTVVVNETDDILEKTGTCRSFSKKYKNVEQGISCKINDGNFKEVVLDFSKINDYRNEGNGLQMEGMVYGVKYYIHRSDEVVCNIYIEQKR